MELAALYSMLDLTDGSVQGGKQRDITFGINWYITTKVRMMANYTFVLNDENANDNGRILGNDDPKIYHLRLQVQF